MAEEIGNVITEVLARLDALAQKLGIAAEQIWGFAVKAKLVQAKRDILNVAAVLPLILALFGWSLHVAWMKLPHDLVSHVEGGGYSTAPIVANGQIIGWQQSTIPLVTTTVDRGLTSEGVAYVVSGFVCLLAGLITGILIAQGAIDAAARLKTAEYDAYQEILSDLVP